MTRSLAALLLAPALVVAAEGDAAPAQSGPKYLGFEVGAAFQTARSPVDNGQSVFFAVNVPTKAVTIGYYFERMDATASSDDDNNGTATKVDVKADIHEVRVVKNLGSSNLFGIGLGVGMGNVDTRIEGGAATGSKPAQVADVFVKFTPLAGGDELKGELNVVLGYRFMRFNGIDLDGGAGDYTDRTNNLDGFRFGLSVGMGF